MPIKTIFTQLFVKWFLGIDGIPSLTVGRNITLMYLMYIDLFIRLLSPCVNRLADLLESRFKSWQAVTFTTL